VSLVLHGALVALAVTGAWRIDRYQSLITIIPPEPPRRTELPPFGGTKRGKGPSGGLGRPPAPAPVIDTTTPPPAPTVGKPDSALAASSAAIGPHLVSPPQVADALYGEEEHKDSVAVHRLRAMVDSLNVIIDQEQRARQKPTWTTEVAGKTIGIDSQYIHVAGIKIPTAVLALLPITLPQGNYDEQRRARQLEDMRQDLMQAARRTETVQLFRQYVRELRARKQAERDAQKRARGDTTTTKADTVKAVP